MTLRNALPLPCWQVTDLRTGEHPQAELGEAWPHYATEDKAVDEADELLRDWLSDNGDRAVSSVPKLAAARAFGQPCVELVCDWCGQAWEDDEYGGTHLDPTQGEPVSMLVSEWLSTLNGKHYCPSCSPPDGETAASAPVFVPVNQLHLPFPASNTGQF